MLIEEQKKKISITIRFNPDDVQTMKEIAANYNLSVSSVVRYFLTHSTTIGIEKNNLEKIMLKSNEN